MVGNVALLLYIFVFLFSSLGSLFVLFVLFLSAYLYFELIIYITFTMILFLLYIVFAFDLSDD